jgi:hypothetical protein
MTCILVNKGEILAYLRLLILYKGTEEYGELRTAFFWVVTQRVMVISLVRNYHYSLRNNPGESRSYLLRSGNLKSRKMKT